MDYKERLNKLKLKKNHLGHKEWGALIVDETDYDWLIEQAEKLQRCKESYSGLDKMYDHWRNKAKELEKQLQQAQEENEKLRKQLSLLCPIADLPVIESLLAEKQMYMEEIQSLKNRIKHLENELRKQLQQAQAKAERYEKALQEIVKYTGSDYTMVSYAIATKVLEDDKK